MNTFKTLAAATSLITVATTGALAGEKYKLDEAHTSVLFFVNHLGFSNMQGEFNDVEGTLWLDREDFSKSKVSATMRSVSVDMDHKELNYHIRSSDFFNVLKFPQLTFESTSVTKGEGNTATMTGNLTMMGVTKPVTLAVELSGEGENPLSKKQTVAFHATGKLKRSDYGMNYLVGAIGDEITIQIDTELFIE